MKALIKPQPKLKIAIFEFSTDQAQQKKINSKISIDFKFYQKLFLLFLTFCIFLIFPESPKDSDVLCKKYHSNEACIVW